MFKNINKKSKIYLTGLLASFILLFLLTAVIFLWVAADKLDILFSQKPGITYTYFMSIMDGVLAGLGIFVLLPLTVYQIFEKEKSHVDRGISIFSVIILLIFTGIFFAGEYHFFQKYKDGELSNSVMFCSKKEFYVFDKILTKNGENIPLKCDTEKE